MADMAIFQVQGPDSVMQSGASPGSSVGDTNDWILFLWFILIVFCPWFRSATSHPVQNTQNHRFFDPKHHFLTHERQKNKKSIFFKSPQFFVPWCGGLPNGMSLFRMRHFWSPKAYLGHMGQNHHISTWRRKNQPIFQNKGFPWNLSRIGCRWSP